jgi:hypothetical protein
MRVIHPVALAVSVSLVSACDRPDGETPGFTARDSAGVRIAENTSPAWDSSSRWTIDSTLLVVGEADAAADQQLHRISGAVRLADGTLVIANGGSRQLLRYDRAGKFLGATGREGDGPGEFRALSWIGRMRGDSLVTWDRGLDRITVFTPDGAYARDYKPKLTENPMTLEVKGALSGGRLLLARGASFISGDGTAGVQRQPITGWLIDSTGIERSSIGPFPGETVFLGPGRQPGATLRTPVPLGASTIFATGRDVVHVVDTDVFAMRSYAADGKLSGIARRPFTAQTIQPSDVATAIDAQLENLPPVQAIRDGMRAAFERVPHPQNLPAVRDLRVDAEDNMWAQVGTRPAAPDAVWSVFDPSGRWLGDVTLPAALTILEIGPDYIVARDRDELDVERVRVMRLRKPASASD